MKTIVQLFLIAAVLFLGYTIATADGPLIVTTTDSQQPPAVAPEPAATAQPAPTAPPALQPAPAPMAEPATVEVEPETAVVTQAGELEVVTAALRNSERVAAACLDQWVKDAMAGKVPQSCDGILNQVQGLTVRHYELTYGGK